MRQIVEERFAADVRESLLLRPRQLPSRYLYDEAGSALFEAICRLPWYSITRAEERQLARHRADVFRLLTPTAIVELGSGSGSKLKLLLEARADAPRAVDVHLVDLSRTALEQSARVLSALDGVRVTTHNATYEDGLSAAARMFASPGRVLALFLGSNIGNFDSAGRHALIGRIRDALRPGDALLLGADLVKSRHVLELAYADPVGVTAAFNRNLLARVNRELDGNFIVDEFAHRAVWNEPESRVEMHLVAERVQEIRVAAADLTFTMAAGETIWTESSYKFRPDGIDALLGASGFRVVAQWVDAQDPFALTLAEAI